MAAVALLQADGRISFAEMSKRLEMPELTVRRLVRRLIDDRVIAITAVANPRLLGLDAMAWIGLRIDWSCAESLPDELMRIRGIDYVATTDGSFQIFAEISARDSTDMIQLISAVRSLPGVRSTETFFYLDLFHQAFAWVGPGNATPAAGGGVRGGGPISELEQRIVLELRRDGRRSIRQIARTLSATERQVSRAFGKLTESGVVRVIAVLNPARMGLTTMALLGMRLRPSADTVKVAETVASEPRVDYVVICTGQYDLLTEVACTSADELVTVLRRLAAPEGIEEIDVFSYLRLQYLDESVWSVGRVSALDPDSSAAWRADSRS